MVNQLESPFDRNEFIINKMDLSLVPTASEVSEVSDEDPNMPPEYDGGDIEGYLGLIEKYVQGNPEKMALFIDTRGEYTEHPELNLAIRNYAFEVLGVIEDIEAMQDAGYNINIDLNHSDEHGRSPYDIKNTIGRYFTNRLPEAWRNYDEGMSTPIEEQSWHYNPMYSQIQCFNKPYLINRIAELSPLITQNFNTLNLYCIQPSDYDISEQREGFYVNDIREMYIMNRMRFAHEFWHYIDDELWKNEWWKISDEVQSEAHPSGIPWGIGIDGLEWTEIDYSGFVSLYAMLWWSHEDFAETISALIWLELSDATWNPIFGERWYSSVMEEAEDNENLKKKVMLTKRILFLVSYGQMDEQYWQDIMDGKVNLEYRATKEKWNIEEQDFYQYIDEFKEFFEKETQVFKSLLAYPNPTTDKVTLKGFDYTQWALELQWSVSGSTTGQWLNITESTDSYWDAKFEINLGNYAPWMYIIKAIDQFGNNYIVKVIKQ